MNGGGSFTDLNKGLPGVYENTITIGRERLKTTNGVTAGGIIMDWQPEGKVFKITAQEFESNPEAVTGYSYLAPENILLREIFRHSGTFLGYRLNEGGKQAEAEGLGKALNPGSVGNNITVSVLRNASDEEKFDVTTYFNNVLKDLQTVGMATKDTISIVGGVVNNGTAIPEDLQTVKVDFTIKDNVITAKYTGVPEGYSLKGQLLLNGKVIALMKGRLEEETGEDTLSYVFYPGASTAAPYTFNARVQKDSDKTYTTLKSEEFTLNVNEGAIEGADATQLKDNTYVTFNKTGLILENAGYVFEGGKSGASVTTSSHVNALNALEPYNFNTLYCDSTNSTVKKLYIEYTTRQRDTRGKYFQTVLHDYVMADNPAIISVKNNVLDTNNIINAGSAVAWTAGYNSAIPLNLELTNVKYDGELNIDTSIPESQQEIMIGLGHFLFHQYSLDEVRTRVDVNTWQSYTEEQDKQLSENKVMRILNYLYNEEERLLNDSDIGRLENDEDGRNVIYNRCYDVLSYLRSIKAIEPFEATDLEVLPCTDIQNPNYKHIAIIRQRIKIIGTIRYIYITTYVVE